MNTMKLLGFATILFILLKTSTAQAVPVPQPEPKTVAAPALQACKVSTTSELGSWDDVFVAHDQDVIVLRRGDQLFSLSMETSATPKKIAKAPAASDTQIVNGAAVDKKLWLFLNSTKATPCAVDAYGGTVARFEIPGLKVPGSRAPVIRACHIVPHAQVALLSVSGGDRATWPRDGNRPIYYWMDLKSGKVVQFPIGWDMNYFSADELVAAFGPERAVDAKTGEKIDAAPDRRKEPHIPFDWTNKQRVRPLYDRREGQGDADFFAGLSIGGRVLRIDLGLQEVRYLSMAKADDDYAGFQLRRSGASHEPGPLWITPFKDSKKTAEIANDVTDFTLLGNGDTIYVMREKPINRALAESRQHAEVFFYTQADRSSWKVLEGVERLPKLGEAFAEATFVHDKLKVQLIEGFGSSLLKPAVLCLFEHHRGDFRARIAQTGRGDEGPALESVTWRRAMLIGRDGKRSLTPFFREGNLPDQIWLHNSGKVISGKYVWDEIDASRTRRIQLSESTVQKQ